MDEIPKQTSRTVYRPPSPGETRRREKEESIRLQAEQDDASLAEGFVGQYRPTQNWTPVYADLMARASAEARALGRGAEEDMINRMLNPGAPPAEPSYRPSPEAMALIARREAEEEVSQEIVDGGEIPSLEDREKRISDREAEIAKREQLALREADLAAREAALDQREKALQPYHTVEQLEDLDSMRAAINKSARSDADVAEGFKPGFSATQTPANWAGRKRMTPEERMAAEAAGVELFGDGSQNSAWSRLDNMPNPDAVATHRPRVSNDPGQRIKDILAQRQDSYTDDADGHAQRLADMVSAQDQVAAEDAAGRDAMRKEQEAYDKRQADAQAVIDKFREEHGGRF